MFEIKNNLGVPVSLVLLPVYHTGNHADNRIEIVIPENGSFSSDVVDGCTKSLIISHEHSSTPFWKGIIPINISSPIVINEDETVSYNNHNLVSYVPLSKGLLSKSIDSLNNYTYIMIISALFILAIWIYKRHKKA